MTSPAASACACLATPLLLVSLLTSCAPAPEPSPTPTPLFTSEADAFAAAEATYRAYNDALNAVDPADPSTFEAVISHTTGKYAVTDRKNLSEMHAEQLTVTGDSVILGFEPLGAAHDFSEVNVRICIDVSAVQIVDPGGVSYVSPTRPPTTAVDVTFVPKRGELVIMNAKTSEQGTCQ